MDSLKIQFTAVLSTSPRWLNVDDEGEARVCFVTSATELGSVMMLATMGKKSLKITVEEEY